MSARAECVMLDTGPHILPATRVRQRLRLQPSDGPEPLRTPILDGE